MSHRHTTDLGLRIEVRTESPDPSVPGSGLLLAAAWTFVAGDTLRWRVEHRDGRKLVVDTKIEAFLKLSAMVDEAPVSADEPDWVARAVAAVQAFEPNLDRANLLQLLSWWSHADRLTVEQTEQVVEQVRAHYGLWPTPADPHWKPPRFERVSEPEPDDEPTGELPESVRRFRAEQAEAGESR